jgi:hypothetical protein
MSRAPTAAIALCSALFKKKKRQTGEKKKKGKPQRYRRV